MRTNVRVIPTFICVQIVFCLLRCGPFVLFTWNDPVSFFLFWFFFCRICIYYFAAVCVCITCSSYFGCCRASLYTLKRRYDRRCVLEWDPANLISLRFYHILQYLFQSNTIFRVFDSLSRCCFCICYLFRASLLGLVFLRLLLSCLSHHCVHSSNVYLLFGCCGTFCTPDCSFLLALPLSLCVCFWCCDAHNLWHTVDTCIQSVSGVIKLPPNVIHERNPE